MLFKNFLSKTCDGIYENDCVTCFNWKKIEFGQTKGHCLPCHYTWYNNNFNIVNNDFSKFCIF